MAVNEGLNDSERYLSGLCKRTFLSLWSFTNVFRQPGTELTDLLVVCGNDIIIFSDKLCEYPVTSDKQLNWDRWFRRAIKDSAKQLWGAENWIKRSPERVFLDSICQLPMPVPIIITPDTKFLLVLVAHGALTACQEEFGGSGSLQFSNEIKGFSQHSGHSGILDHAVPCALDH